MILKFIEKDYLKDNLPHVYSLKHINTCGDNCILYGMTKLRISVFWNVFYNFRTTSIYYNNYAKSWI